MFFVLLAVVLLCGFLFYKLLLGRKEAAATQPPTTQMQTSALESTQPPTEDAVQAAQPTAEPIDVSAERAEEILDEMTLYEKLCQLIILVPDTITGISPTREAGEVSKSALEKYPVCGFSFAQGNISTREQTISMLAGFQKSAKFACLAGRLRYPSGSRKHRRCACRLAGGRR